MDAGGRTVIMSSKYESEAEFLKHYRPSDFEKLSLTTDILLFSVSEKRGDNYRKVATKQFSVLLVKRDTYPFKDKWCIPGGFMKMNETTDEAAIRVLGNETNLHNIYMEQLYTFSDVKRDPRMRIVSTAYMALINKNQLTQTLNEKAKWFAINIVENDTLTMELTSHDETLTFTYKKHLLNETTSRFDFHIIQNNCLAFDHAKVLCEGISRLRNKIEYTDIVFNMMPDLFTLGDLQRVYEAILGKKLIDAAFRRNIKQKVTKTDRQVTSGGHRPSYLYRYK